MYITKTQSAVYSVDEINKGNEPVDEINKGNELDGNNTESGAESATLSWKSAEFVGLLVCGLPYNSFKVIKYICVPDVSVSHHLQTQNDAAAQYLVIYCRHGSVTIVINYSLLM